MNTTCSRRRSEGYLTMPLLLAAILAMILSGAAALAQVTTATVSGVIKDSSGAVVPGVNITASNVETGLTRTGTTAADGTYTLPALPVGTYNLRAEHPGFETAVQEALKLNVGQSAVINFTLTLGTVQQTVAVTAEAPMIETTTATVTGLVNDNQMRDLPLNARNLIQLATLFPDVTITRPGTGSAGVANGFATKLTISGTRFNSSLFQLDGQDINDDTGSAGGAAGILMGVETVREFDVITHGYSAEYGKHTGGVFNAITKSGTNGFHGSAFEFLRNSDLDARNFFDIPIKPPLKRNQFGGTLGGPIKKDHTFFFGSYEGLRTTTGLTQTFTVPDAGARNGILGTAGAPVTVNAVVVPFLNSYPLPNGGDNGNGTGQFLRPFTLPTSENFVAGRVDERFSDNDSLFGRYTFDNATTVAAQSFNATLNSRSRDQYVAVGETHTFSPQLLNMALLAFNRSLLSQVSPPLAGFTYPLATFTSFTAPTPGISVTTLSAWGGNAIAPTEGLLNNYQVKDDIYYTHGDHSLKFGFNTERQQFLRATYFDGAGAFSFSSLSSFLQGTPSQFAGMTANSDPNAYTRQSLYGIYAQDDYRVSSRLTLNLGLRYEFISTPYVLHGRISNLHNYLAPGQSEADLTLGNPFYLNPSLHNFAPRIGFAWDPTGSGKTSIRGGAGIFFDQALAGPFGFSFVQEPPFYNNDNIVAANHPVFPNAFFVQQSLLAGAPETEPMQYSMQQPTIYKYSFGIQRQLAHNLSVDVGYDGLRGVHLITVEMENMPVGQVVNGRILIPSTAPMYDPGLGRTRTKESRGTSSYNSGHVKVSQRLSRGIQVQGSYTFSKAIDSGTNWAGSTEFGNSPGQERYLGIIDKGPSAFDIRNAFTGNFIYDLPGAKLQGAEGVAFGGWQMSGIVTLQNGPPFTVTSGAEPAWMSSGFVGDYPDRAVGTPVTYLTQNPNHYFSPTAFMLPPNTPTVGVVGNLGRDTMNAPGIAQFDWVLGKRFPLHERLALDFRAEFYNLFNRPNFGFPNAAAFQPSGSYNPLAGKITDTGSLTSRQLQFGLKLEF